MVLTYMPVENGPGLKDLFSLGYGPRTGTVYRIERKTADNASWRHWLYVVARNRRQVVTWLDGEHLIVAGNGQTRITSMASVEDVRRGLKL